MQFDQLIKYNIFLEKSYTKFGGEFILWPFSEKAKLSISLSNKLNFYTVLFLFYAKLRVM